MRCRLNLETAELNLGSFGVYLGSLASNLGSFAVYLGTYLGNLGSCFLSFLGSVYVSRQPQRSVPVYAATRACHRKREGH